MFVNRKLLFFLLLLLCLSAACSASNGDEPALEDNVNDNTLEGAIASQAAAGDKGYDENPDAAYFAEDVGISLEEANRRLSFQETIGEIQPLLMADLGDIFGGLWVENQPAYRIVIALTEGDESTIQPYIAHQAWVGAVEVVTVQYNLAQLIKDQETAGGVARQIKVPVTTAVDVIGNRVEVIVGNPELFLEELAQAGLALPESAVVTASDPGGELPDSNRGTILEGTLADNRTVFLPRQAPSSSSMAALIEATLVENKGCLRLTDENYPDGFMVIWRHDNDLRIRGQSIEVLNHQGAVIARVGETMQAGGGAFEAPNAGEQLSETIPGLPLGKCPGPFWILGEVKPLAQQ